MAKNYLVEAFQEMDELDDTTFEVDEEGIKQVKDVLDDHTEVVQAYDLDATDDAELKDNYVGKVILKCPVCQSLIYKDREEIKEDEDERVVNASEECPYCMQVDGYTIVGQVCAYDEEANQSKDGEELPDEEVPDSEATEGNAMVSDEGDDDLGEAVSRRGKCSRSSTRLEESNSPLSETGVNSKAVQDLL